MIALPGGVYIPDGDDAQRAAEDELSKAIYAAPEPTWFDRAVNWVVESFSSLFSQDAGNAGGGVGLIIITALVIAALIAVLILWGRPRRSHARARQHGDLLGERDDRTAAELRADAERSARDSEWDAAIVTRFRALAKSLLERDIVTPAPGATAQAIARATASVLVTEAQSMHTAARIFDDVRYLRRPGTEALYRELSTIDDRLQATRMAVPA